jgi:hypothetical protein
MVVGLVKAGRVSDWGLHRGRRRNSRHALNGRNEPTAQIQALETSRLDQVLIEVDHAGFP